MKLMDFWLFFSEPLEEAKELPHQ
ncbi:hypothetical protein RED65_16641 [Oceanobacter sp. RED65]|uniref:Uncharacterized protein n=1 Tax=Bermanella marisrubri TaxID=207949 RepID=Q1N2C3_9GAMM|nr:hypothetical protein RED65_16641 [Oceanobacter sp. RED65] [Bermanella marisrubri]